MKFLFDKVVDVEFGVGVDEHDFYIIQVGEKVKHALTEMAYYTYQCMLEISDTPEAYNPSQKYGASEFLTYSLASSSISHLNYLHTADNLSINMSAISDPSGLQCYFVRLRDSNDSKITCVKRATQFKGVVKQKLITIIDDNFQLIPDRVFKLDRDFDLLIHEDELLILHPTGFTMLGAIEEEIMGAVPTNVSILKAALPMVDFSNIESYALNHPRAAKYLASIISTGEMDNIDPAALKTLCIDNQVVFDAEDPIIQVNDRHVRGFLEVLDRRRYCISLVPGSPEKYIAANRNKL